MSETASELVLLRDLKHPHEAAGYLWASKGDIATARATQSIDASLRRAIGEGRRTFRWALPPKYSSADATPYARETDIEMRIVTFRVEVFRSGKHYGDFHAARFDTPEDQALFMTEMPYLAIGAAPLPEPPK